MTIIEQTGTNGWHPMQSQSHRTECWKAGWIAVPQTLEEMVLATCGWCDLDIRDGVLVGITPTAWPEPEPPPLDALTMTQLAVAELAQTVEDNNTANQLAIAELAETILGGKM